MLISGLLICFYVYVLSLSLHPQASIEHKLFYIDQVLSYWPKTNGLNYQLGKPIDFTKKRKVVYLSRSGWSFPENTGRWTVGNLASLYLVVKDAIVSDLTLQLRCIPMLNNKHPSLESSLSVNGREIGNVVYKLSDQVAPHGTYAHEFVIPYGLIKTSELTRIDLRIKNPVSPSAIKKSKDKRILGMMVKTMTLKPVLQD